MEILDFVCVAFFVILTIGWVVNTIMESGIIGVIITGLGICFFGVVAFGLQALYSVAIKGTQFELWATILFPFVLFLALGRNAVQARNATAEMNGFPDGQEKKRPAWQTFLLSLGVFFGCLVAAAVLVAVTMLWS
jgi:hypothetical protein